MTDFYLGDPALFRDNTSTMAYPLLINLVGKSPEEALSAIWRPCTATTNAVPPCNGRMPPTAAFVPRTWLPGCRSTQTTPRASTWLTSKMIPHSLLNFYKRMLQARRSAPALIAGDYALLHEQSGTTWLSCALPRQVEQTCLVVLKLFCTGFTDTLRPARPTSAADLFSSHVRRRRLSCSSIHFWNCSLLKFILQN